MRHWHEHKSVQVYRVYFLTGTPANRFTCLVRKLPKLFDKGHPLFGCPRPWPPPAGPGPCLPAAGPRAPSSWRLDQIQAFGPLGFPFGWFFWEESLLASAFGLSQPYCRLSRIGGKSVCKILDLHTAASFWQWRRNGTGSRSTCPAQCPCTERLLC